MATQGTYYLDAPSLASATVIYSDAGLTIVAPNGFYSDGTIVREQVSGVLLPQTSCPSCIPVTYNCISGNCVDPGDGTGTYATLAACQAACFAESYNCIEGTCIDPGDGTGTYPTLAACQAACNPPCECHDGVINNNNAFSYYDCNGVLFAGGAELGSEICYNINAPHTSNITDNGISAICFCNIPITYNCVSGNCVDPGDGSGTYSTLAACQAACFPVSYNCVSGNCVDPGDGTGTYATLAACEAACGIAESYNCVDGNCIDPGDGSGTYATLAACQAACTPPPCECHDGVINNNNAFSYYSCDGVFWSGGAELGSEICYNINAPHSGNITDNGISAICFCDIPASYDCVEGNCIDPGDGSGAYATLAACQAACGTPPPASYNCVSGNCVDPGDGSGTYATLAACQAACSTPPVVSYDCVDGNCVDPGDGSGAYASLATCQAACTPPPASYDCVEGNCVDPGDGSGAYATLAACQAACGTPPPASFNCVDGNCVDPGDGSGAYATLAACEAECTPPPPSLDWECVNLGQGLECIYVGGGTGSYTSLAQCQNDCAGT